MFITKNCTLLHGGCLPALAKNHLLHKKRGDLVDKRDDSLHFPAPTELFQDISQRITTKVCRMQCAQSVPNCNELLFKFGEIVYGLESEETSGEDLLPDVTLQFRELLRNSLPDEALQRGPFS